MIIEQGKHWDVSWNPIKAKDRRFYKAHTGDVEFVLDEKALEKPLHWRKPRVVAVQWMGDLFHKDIPHEMVKQLFIVMAWMSKYKFLLLTKRPERLSEFIKKEKLPLEMFPHIWLGLTVCTQQEADEKIPILLQIPAAHRWLSIEPMLEDIRINWNYNLHKHLNGIHQVIVGGESGHNARPMHPDWPRRIRDDCAEAGVPFFFKQWGEWYPAYSQYEENEEDYDIEQAKMRFYNSYGWCRNNLCFQNNGVIPIKGDEVYHQPQPEHNPYFMYRVGKKKAGRLLDGKEHNQLAWRCDENE